MTRCAPLSKVILIVGLFRWVLALLFYVQHRQKERMSALPCAFTEISDDIIVTNFLCLATKQQGQISDSSIYWIRPSILREKSYRINFNLTETKQIFQNDSKLLAAGVLNSNSNTTQYCKLSRTNYSYVMTESNETSIRRQIGRFVCFACDIPSGAIFLRGSVLKSDQLWRQLNDSAALHIFYLTRGNTLQCLTNQPTTTSLDWPVTCNNLPTWWDPSFIFYAKLLNIWYLEVRTNRAQVEYAWLGCHWSKSSWDKALPIACAQWVRQFLYDTVDILNILGEDYRLMYGSLIGAIRNSDVIPWSPDADILLLTTDYPQVVKKWKDQLAGLSGNRYSALCSDGDYHRDFTQAIKTFPSCPVRFDSLSDHVTTQQINDEISEQSSSVDTSFSEYRSVPYVDLYSDKMFYKYLHYRKTCPQVHLTFSIYKPSEKVAVGAKTFKGFHDGKRFLRCFYSNDVLEKIPSKAHGDWDQMID